MKVGDIFPDSWYASAEVTSVKMADVQMFLTSHYATREDAFRFTVEFDLQGHATYAELAVPHYTVFVAGEFPCAAI